MTSKTDRLAIAAALREAGTLLDIQGENRFRARAFTRAAKVIQGLSDDLGTLVAEKRLIELRGIGPAIAAVIEDLVLHGSSALLDKLRSETSASAAELARVPGLTPKRVAALQQALDVRSVPELEAAARAGQVRAVKGFGEASEKKLLAAIERYRAGGETILLAEALENAEALRDWLRALPGCTTAEIAGAIRRSQELVDGIDVVAAFEEPEAVCEDVAAYPAAARVEEERDGVCVLRLADGTRARVTIVKPAAFPEALHRATGSDAHVARLALLRRSPGAAPASSDRQIYAAAGLPFIPPELREDAGEIEAALAGDAFDDLIRQDDIRGMVHCHTTHSDGRNSVEEMARAAEAMGMTFITMTDHSPSAFYARGLDADRLARQWDEIDRAQERVSIRILKGTESDILADGSLDYPDDLLERLDVVIASVHTRHKLDRAQMTSRVIRAMRHPAFKIWGHALGRLLKQREPFDCDVNAILDAIAESRAAVEINGDPHRLDLEPAWIREARKRRIPFVISTDAHSTGQLQNLRFGVGIARRGGVRRQEVLNALDAAAFARAVRPAAGS